MEEKPLVNRVASSGLITLNLEDYFPKEGLVVFDLKDYLYMELILKEKDFRGAMKDHDWSQYDGKNLAVFCSNDAIIPVWAYMLVTTYAEPFAKEIFWGNEEAFYSNFYTKVFSKLDLKSFENNRIVIKGCGDLPVPVSAYLEVTKILRPIAKSIMYGEPCSTVPIYKKKIKR
ncbi:MAG: DUF2480 family protein [Bacteroidia bacterium]|nr:DUF2480 family protein [Bacteroidia bacterium]